MKLHIKFGSAEFGYEADSHVPERVDALVEKFYKFISDGPSTKAAEPASAAPSAAEERAAEAAVAPLIVDPNAPFKLDKSLKGLDGGVDETHSWNAGDGIFGTKLSVADTQTALHNEPLANVSDQMARVAVESFMGRPIIEYKMDDAEPDRLTVIHR